MLTHHYPYLGAWLPIIVLFVLLVAAFEVWMLIDVAINAKLSNKAKAWWIVGMVAIHPFVAIVYYFTDRNKR